MMRLSVAYLIFLYELNKCRSFYFYRLSSSVVERNNEMEKVWFSQIWWRLFLKMCSSKSSSYPEIDMVYKIWSNYYLFCFPICRNAKTDKNKLCTSCSSVCIVWIIATIWDKKSWPLFSNTQDSTTLGII